MQNQKADLLICNAYQRERHSKTACAYFLKYRKNHVYDQKDDKGIFEKGYNLPAFKAEGHYLCPERHHRG